MTASHSSFVKFFRYPHLLKCCSYCALLWELDLIHNRFGLMEFQLTLHRSCASFSSHSLLRQDFCLRRGIACVQSPCKGPTLNSAYSVISMFDVSKGRQVVKSRLAEPVFQTTMRSS